MSEGIIFPKYPRRSRRGGRCRRRDAGGTRRSEPLSAQSARRARAADRGDGRDGPWNVDELYATVRHAAPFAELSRPIFEGVLDMLSGRYPSDEFAELRPRITWDRVDGHAHRAAGRAARRDRQRRHDPRPRTVRRVPRRAPSNAARARRRARRGDGVRDPRRRDVPPRRLDLAHRRDHARPRARLARARASPARCRSGRRRRGAAARARATRSGSWCASSRETPARSRARAAARATHGLDARAAENLLQYLDDQAAATGARARRPHHRDRALARRARRLARLRARRRSAAGCTRRGRWRSAAAVRDEHGARSRDDVGGRRLRRALPGDRRAARRRAAAPRPRRGRAAGARQLGSTALFAARFREAAARALLLPTRRPGGRAPLWQQRKRAADLLAVAARFGSFPMLLETYRECLRDVFDCPRSSRR